jgi:sulfur transfer complex TusBCD TusB component (DsrH family)
MVAETVAETVDVMARGIASRTGTAIKVASRAVMVAVTVPLPSKSQ